MLTRLEVDGFKSLSGFSIDLEPFTVLVGPNGVGKSNVLEAIGLVARLANGRPEEVLKGGRGRASDQFTRAGAEVAQTMKIALESFEPDHQPAEDFKWADRYRYEIELAKVGTGSGVEHVKLQRHVHLLPGSTDTWLADHPEWAKLVVGTPDRPEEALPLFDYLELHSAQPREPSDRIDSGRLASDASNLPSVLAALSEVTLGEIRARLAGLVPGVSDFEVIERDEAYQIEFRMRDGDIVPARLASNGTLRVLALLTALHDSSSYNSVICIEEPENGIYPGRLRRLIDLLRDLTSSTAWSFTGQVEYPPPQVIVTTHSPVFLAALGEHPIHLRYIDTVRRGGVRATRARRVGEPGSPAAGRGLISARDIAAILNEATGSAGDR